jgi:hypothetical protein
VVRAAKAATGVARAAKAATGVARTATIAEMRDFALERATAEAQVTGQHGSAGTRLAIARNDQRRDAIGPTATAAAVTSGEAGPTRSETGVAGAPNVGAATAALGRAPGKSEDVANRAAFGRDRAMGTEQEADARRARGLVAPLEATLPQANDLASAADPGRSGHRNEVGRGLSGHRSAAGRGRIDRRSAVAPGRIAAPANVRGVIRRRGAASARLATSDLFGPVAPPAMSVRTARLPRPLTRGAPRLRTSAIWSSRMRRSSPAGVR